jgi:hypothetical protein
MGGIPPSLVTRMIVNFYINRNQGSSSTRRVGSSDIRVKRR